MNFALWISFTKVGDSKPCSLKTSLLRKDFDLLRNSRPTVPMYADGRELLVFQTFSQSFSVLKRVFRHAGGAHLKDAPHCLIVLTSVFCDVREGAAEDAAQIIECAGADVAVFAQAVELTAADAVLLTVGLLTACGGSGLSKQMLVGKWSYIYILQRTQKLSEVKKRSCLLRPARPRRQRRFFLYRA